MIRVSLICSLLLAMMGLVSCSSTPPYTVQYYQPAYRSSPPAPVYSRVMWSHLPAPIRPKNIDNGPYLLPFVSFDFPDSTLDEAIEALAQTMGYRWDYPSGLAKRPIRIKMEGTVEEILREIGKQAGAETMFDHQHRLVRVIEKEMLPRLPGR